MEAHQKQGFISKERFAREEITKGLARVSTEEKIRLLYESFCETGSTDVLNDLILNTERLVAGIVCSTLIKSAYFSGDVEDAMQDITLQFVNLVTSDRQNGTRQKDIIHTIRSLYKKRSIDVVRAQYAENKGHSLMSLDAMNTDAEGRARERVGTEDILTDEEKQLTAEKCDLSRRLLRIYLHSMLNYRYEPQKPLGLCYGRILYQLEMMYNPVEIDLAGSRKASRDKRKTLSEYDKMVYAFWDAQSPATSTSISWATGRMLGKNLGQLSAEAQASLQEHFDSSLKWGNAYLAKLQEPSTCEGMPLWKYVVYTDEFTPKQTSAWTESIHVSVFKTALAAVEADPTLLDEVLGSDLPFRAMMTKIKGGTKREALDER